MMLLGKIIRGMVNVKIQKKIFLYRAVQGVPKLCRVYLISKGNKTFTGF